MRGRRTRHPELQHRSNDSLLLSLCRCTLCWQKLKDLDGFEVHWGLASRAYDGAVDIPDETSVEFTTPAASISIPSPGPEGGNVIVFFAMTAYDTGVIRDATINCTGDSSDDDNDPGNEVDCRNVSAFSNEVAKVVTFADQTPDGPQLLNVIINVDTS